MQTKFFCIKLPNLSRKSIKNDTLKVLKLKIQRVKEKRHRQNESFNLQKCHLTSSFGFVTQLLR